MDSFTYIVIIVFLHVTFGKDCVINKVPERMAFEKQLRKDLNCDNHRYEPPPGGNSSTFSVNIKFRLKRFTFDSDTEVMSIQTWMLISWKDERIKWDPEKYYGINSTEVISVSIWSPGFRLFNSVDSHDFDRYFYTWCDVNNTGDVHCVFKQTHNVLCPVKLTNWPYDQQECSFEFGPWIPHRNSPKKEVFRLDFSPHAITMLGAEYGAEWFISDYRQEGNSSSERQLKMIFTLEREATGLGAIVVYPAAILTTLSVTSLFLDVRRFVRLSIACFSVFGHYYFLMELAENIPKQSFDPPNLLLYYRGSMVITVLIILVSFLLRIICKLKSTPQNYIISTNDAVYESYGKYFIVPQWNVNDDTIDCKRFSQDWTKFANVINCVFTVVIIIAYICMYCTLVPKPIPFT